MEEKGKGREINQSPSIFLFISKVASLLKYHNLRYSKFMKGEGE